MNEIPKWRKAKIKFLTKQHHNLRDYGYSTRGCDTIHPGTIREVYFEWWDKGIEGLKPGVRFAHVELHDLIPMTDADFEIIELGEPEEMHPTERMLAEWRDPEKQKAIIERALENVRNAPKAITHI